MPTYSRGLANGYRLDMILNLASQSVANNTSTYNYTLQIVDTTGWYAWSGHAASFSFESPGGSAVRTGQLNGYKFSSTPGNTLVLATGSFTFGHNADGTSSRGVWLNFFDSGGPLGNGTCGGTLTTATIPRATQPKMPTSATTGSAVTISLPRAASGFTHAVSYALGSKKGTIASAAGVTASWTPGHDLATEFPNATKAEATITVVTKSGSSTIGTKTVKTTVNLAGSIAPSVSAVAWTDTNAEVRTKIGAFVEGLSLIKGAVTAAGVHGSTIKTRQLRVGSAVMPEGTVMQIVQSGQVAASGEAVDSRGRSASRSAPFEVLPYRPPRLGAGGWSVDRANDANVPTPTGAYLRIDLHAIASSLVVGGLEKNTLLVTVATKSSTGGWVERNVIRPGLAHSGEIQVSGGAAFPVSSSYEVQVTLSDETGMTPTVLRTVIPTATVALDLNGTMVGVGKYHERGTLDVAGDVFAQAFYAGASDPVELTEAGVSRVGGGVPLLLSNAGTTPGSDVVVRTPDNSAIRLDGPILSNRRPKVLWSGQIFLQSGQNAPMSERLSDQLTGIVLVWSRYVSGSTANDSWVNTFVNKAHHALSPVSTGMSIVLGSGASAQIANIHKKYVYIDDDIVRGHANNSDANNGSNYTVLRYILGV